MEGLAKSLALEGRAHGIGAYAVTPGMYMKTPMSERNYSEALKQMWIDPHALTPAFVALAERKANFECGQRIDAWALSRSLLHT